MRALLAVAGVKPVLWAAGAGALLCAVLAVWALLLRADLAAMGAERDALRVERDLWQQQASTVNQAAASQRDGISTLRGLLEQQQAACLAIGEQNRQAAERADAVARRAERALSDYRRRAAGAGADCEAALKQMEVACPALSNY